MEKGEELSGDVIQSLSDLEDDMLSQFVETWRRLGGEQRTGLLEHLSQATDESAVLDFRAIYQLALTDPDPEVRALGLSLVAEEADPELLDTFLRAAVSDPDDDARVAALDGLGAYTLAAQTGGWDDESQRKLETSLVGVLHLQGASFALRRAALLSLAYLTTPRSEVEIRQAHLQPDLREAAVEAMGHNCQDIWIEDIVSELDAEEPELRLTAVRAVAELEDQQLVPHLVSRLRDSEAEVRLAAIEALGVLGGKDAKGMLSELLASRNRATREAARNALETLVAEEDPFRAL